ncbi:hypothetical protein MTR67_051760 [Solanum verrucosum]|uniref:Integrase zinc-binding domain-containing protein n=1 Tax=Solanum verrucosum TaxID=315347 RepID=A0AAF0V4K1_SOLVR|nr:hypothetical protein MTR67_051760 [Solanum verrucosum]
MGLSKRCKMHDLRLATHEPWVGPLSMVGRHGLRLSLPKFVPQSSLSDPNDGPTGRGITPPTDREQIGEEFLDEHLMVSDTSQVSWYADIVNIWVSGVYPLGSTTQQKKKKQTHNAKFYIWDEPFLFKQGVDQVLRRCIPEYEVKQVLEIFHASLYTGHHGGERTTHKVLQSGFFWPSLFNDSITDVKGCK